MNSPKLIFFNPPLSLNSANPDSDSYVNTHDPNALRKEINRHTHQYKPDR
jgi:hypothetical protein